MKKRVCLVCAGGFGLILLLFAPHAWAMAKKPPPPVTAPSFDRIAQPAKLFTLSDCYELALKRSETIAIQQQEIEFAVAQFFRAASEAVGDVNFLMTDFRQDAPKPEPIAETGFGRTFTARHLRERRFVIRQPLFQGFRALGALTGAGSLKKQRQAEWRRAEQLLFLDVVVAFYNVLRYDKEIKILVRIDELFHERIKELEAREQIGRSRPSEVVTASSRMRIIEADLARLRGLLEVSKHILGFLTGMEMDVRQLEEEDLEVSTRESLEDFLESIENRPDVEAAFQAVKNARSNFIISQSGLWPQISLENSHYVKREGFDKDFDWDLLFTINIPIGLGGENIGKIKEAMSGWRKAKYSYSLAQRQADLEIKEAYENWIATLNESKALEAAVRDSEENFRLQTEEYEQNLVSNLDVLAALESLQQTQRDANDAYYRMKFDYWHLKVAQGETL